MLRAEKAKMRMKFKRILYILVQCTWGLGQTLIGLGFFIANRKHPHKVYRCCIDTQWDYGGGLSLGLFIFTPREGGEAQPIRVHEYGHTIQSLILGPLYAIAGAISVTWANLPYFVKKRRERRIPYTACFVEANASRVGEKVTKEKAVWN